MWCRRPACPKKEKTKDAGKMPAPQGSDAGKMPASQEPEAGWKPAPQPSQRRKEPGPEEIAASSEPPLTLGACALRKEPIAALVRDALRHFQGLRYHLHAWCIMPNHVHVVVTPLAGFGLKGILHSWKSYTGNQANRALQAQGAFWERESFDHAIRSPEHFERFVQYTEQNPVTAGLCGKPEEWPWSSCGSGFR